MINQELSPEDLAAIDAALQQPDIPLDTDLVRAWTELQSAPSYTERQARAKAMYTRLKDGETLHVQTGDTHKRFSIRPEYWENIILDYSIIEKGQVVLGYNGLMLDPDTVKDWLSELVEVVQQ